MFTLYEISQVYQVYISIFSANKGPIRRRTHKCDIIKSLHEGLCHYECEKGVFITADI
jgi:hypothetical protein